MVQEKVRQLESLLGSRFDLEYRKAMYGYSGDYIAASVIEAGRNKAMRMTRNWAAGCGLDEGVVNAWTLKEMPAYFEAASYTYGLLRDNLQVLSVPDTIGQKDMEQNAGKEVTMDDILGGAEMSNNQYGAWQDMSAHVMQELSQRTGWKGTSRPLDFTYFSGYRFEDDGESVAFRHDGELLCSFSPTGDGGFDCNIESPELEGLSLMDLTNYIKISCLSDDNVALARDEMHGGYEVIYGMEFNGVVAFGVDEQDMNLRRKLTGLYDNVRFTTIASLGEALDTYIDRIAKPGAEKPMPQIRIYFYNGEEVQNERTLDVFGKRPFDMIEADRRLISEVRDRAMKVRDQFEKTLGIPEGMRFQFERALVPSLSYRDDALFLTTDCGKDTFTFIQASGGELTLNRKYNPEMPGSSKVRTFSSINEAVNYVRDIISHPLNAEQAAKEWKHFSEEQSQKTAETQRNSTGMKIK